VPEVEPVVTPATKRPKPLTKAEKQWAAALIVVGAIVLIGTVAWFAGSTGGSLKTKETKTTKASGTTPEQTSTTEYSDSVLLAGLGTAAGLLLAGAFYARMREIKLPGNVDVTLSDGEVPQEKKDKIDQAITQTIDQATKPADVSSEVIKQAARQVAHTQLKQDYPGPATKAASDAYLEQLGSTSAREILQAL
jgi:hypothetical protein